MERPWCEKKNQYRDLRTKVEGFYGKEEALVQYILIVSKLLLGCGEFQGMDVDIVVVPKAMSDDS